MATHLYEVVDVDDLHRRIAEGYISCKRHPVADLSIYNYTKLAQYDRSVITDQVVRACRGLIVNGDGIIVARPFAKFGNVGEHESRVIAVNGSDGVEYIDNPLPPLPVNERFEVFDKVDGSLGIIYPVDGTWAVATRGSFVSEQAKWATTWLRERVLPTFTPTVGQTLLAEIISPVSRIVVSYDFDGLVLLANIDNDSGRDVDLPAAWPTRVVQRYAFDNFAAVAAMAGTDPDGSQNSEGFVVRFESGVRAKIKWGEYLRLHRLLTGVTTRTIWEYAAIDTLAADYGLTADNATDADRAQAVKAIAYTVKRPVDEVLSALTAARRPLAVLLEEVPDEFFTFVENTIAGFRKQAQDLDDQARALHATMTAEYTNNRKDIAMAVGKHPLKAILFRMLDDRPYSDQLWKDLRPSAGETMKADEA